MNKEQTQADIEAKFEANQIAFERHMQLLDECMEIAEKINAKYPNNNKPLHRCRDFFQETVATEDYDVEGMEKVKSFMEHVLKGEI